MKLKNIILALSFLLIAFQCGPSYLNEMPRINEKEFSALPFEEKFEVYKNVSGYIDTPIYVRDGIKKEGKKIIPLLLNFIERSDVYDKKRDVLYMLSELHVYYFPLNGTEVEEFLKRKVREDKENKDTLELYKSTLEIIQTRKNFSPSITVLTPGFGNIPAFYSEDEAVINSVNTIKEKIIEETGMSQKELDARFAIHSYTKERLSFFTKIDWIMFRDDLNLELSKQIEVPFYFNIKKLKPKSEIEKIISKKDLRLKPVILPPNNEYNMQINHLDKEILLVVFGIINEDENKCIAGKINLVNGKIETKETFCRTIDD